MQWPKLSHGRQCKTAFTAFNFNLVAVKFTPLCGQICLKKSSAARIIMHDGGGGKLVYVHLAFKRNAKLFLNAADYFGGKAVYLRTGCIAIIYQY